MSLQINQSQSQNNDLFDYLLKNSSTTKRMTHMNADLLLIQSNSVNQKSLDENNGLVDFNNVMKGQNNNDELIMIEQNFQNNQEILESKQVQQNKQHIIQKVQQSKQILNLCRNESKYIFRDKTIRKEGKKNTNLPKFLFRILIKYFDEIQESQEVIQKFKTIQKRLKNAKTNNYNMTDILQLLYHDDEKNQNLGKLNRITMQKILRSKLKKQVILNRYVTNNRLTYMITAKVFSLRCRSKLLAQRLQFR